MRGLRSWLRHPVKPRAGIVGRALFAACIAAVLEGLVDVYLLVAYAFGGRYQSCGKTPNQSTCDILASLVLLPVGGIVTGTAFGALSPILKRYWLAIPSASVAMIPLSTAVALTFVEETPWAPLRFAVFVVATSTTMGWTIAHCVWLRQRGEGQ